MLQNEEELDRGKIGPNVTSYIFLPVPHGFGPGREDKEAETEQKEAIHDSEMESLSLLRKNGDNENRIDRENKDQDLHKEEALDTWRIGKAIGLYAQKEEEIIKALKKIK